MLGRFWLAVSRAYPDAVLMGLDMGYFGNCLSSNGIFPECRLNQQYFGDVRNFSAELLSGVDAVVYLAALSTTPWVMLLKRRPWMSIIAPVFARQKLPKKPG